MQQNNKIVGKLRALGEPTRLGLALLLAEGGELGGTDLLERLDVSQPSLSRHLKVLRAAGVIVERRDGRNAFYRLSGDVVTGQILALAADLRRGRPGSPSEGAQGGRESMSIRTYDKAPAVRPDLSDTPSEDPPPAPKMEDWML